MTNAENRKYDKRDTLVHDFLHIDILPQMLRFALDKNKIFI